MALPWEGEQVEEHWGDREGWRGDSYPDVADRWMDEEIPAPEPVAEDTHGGSTPRGELLLEAWMETLARRMYRTDKNLRRPPTG